MTISDPAYRQAVIIPGVTGAQVTGVKGDATLVDVGYTPPPVSSAARHIMTQIRALVPRPGLRS